MLEPPPPMDGKVVAFVIIGGLLLRLRLPSDKSLLMLIGVSVVLQLTLLKLPLLLQELIVLLMLQAVAKRAADDAGVTPESVEEVVRAVASTMEGEADSGAGALMLQLLIFSGEVLLLLLLLLLVLLLLVEGNVLVLLLIRLLKLELRGKTVRDLDLRQT